METDLFSFLNIKSFLFNNKTVNQTFYKNLFWLVFTEFVTKIAGLVAIVLLVRHYGPIIYGEFAFSLNFVAIFSIFADFGLSVLAVREISKDNNDTSKYIDNILAIKFLLSVIVFLCIALSSFFIKVNSETFILMYLLAVYSLLSTFSNFFQAIFRAYEKMEYESISRIVESSLSLLFIILFVFYTRSIIYIGYAYILGAGMGCILPLFFIWKYFSKFFLKINLVTCKEIFKKVLPIGAVSALTMILYLADSIIIGIVRSKTEVGLYNAATQIIFSIIPLSSVIFFVFFPKMSAAFKENQKNLKSIMEECFFLMVGVALPMSFGGFVLAPQLINFLYGKLYIQTVLPFEIVIWNMIFIFLIAFYGNSLWVFNKQREFFKIFSIGTCFNILMNLIFIQKYGIIAASIISVMTEILIMIQCIIYFNKIFRINIGRIFFSALISSCIMTLFLIGLSAFYVVNLIVFIILGMIVFLSFYLGLRFFNKKLSLNNLQKL